MDKKQNKNKKMRFENCDKLVMACRMILEIKSGLSYWKFKDVWPTNLYYDTLGRIVDLINEVLLSSDFSNEPNKTLWPQMK